MDFRQFNYRILLSNWKEFHLASVSFTSSQVHKWKIFWNQNETMKSNKKIVQYNANSSLKSIKYRQNNKSLLQVYFSVKCVRKISKIAVKESRIGERLRRQFVFLHFLNWLLAKCWRCLRIYKYVASKVASLNKYQTS